MMARTRVRLLAAAVVIATLLLYRFANRDILLRIETTTATPKTDVGTPQKMRSVTLEAILIENGLGKWYATLVAEEVTLKSIGLLTIDELKELGLPLGVRKHIVELFAVKPALRSDIHTTATAITAAEPTQTDVGTPQKTETPAGTTDGGWQDAIDFVIPWTGPVPNDDGNMATARQRENGEMKYMLRSFAMHAPWVRKVWILVNGPVQDDSVEIPHSIANRTHVVDRCSFMPKGTCPTRNGFSARAFAHHLPGLAEHWVLIDDDIFLGRDIKPSFLFQDGKPFVWHKTPLWGFFKGQQCHELYENPDVVTFATPKSAAPSPHFWYPQLKSVNEATELKFPEFYKFVGSHRDGRFWSRKPSGPGPDEEYSSQEEDVQV